MECPSAGGYNKRTSLPSTYQAAVLPFSIITGLAGEYIMISQDVSFVDTTTLFLILSTTPASSPFPSCLSIDSYSSINLYAMKSLLLFPEF